VVPIGREFELDATISWDSSLGILALGVAI
jgi:hypothetical protein